MLGFLVSTAGGELVAELEQAASSGFGAAVACGPWGSEWTEYLMVGVPDAPCTVEYGTCGAVDLYTVSAAGVSSHAMRIEGLSGFNIGEQVNYSSSRQD